MSMTHKDVREVQRRLNTFTETYKRLGFRSLRIDGNIGELTKKRIKEVKRCLGYTPHQIDDSIGNWLFWRLEHPNQVDPTHGATKEIVREGRITRAKRIRAVRRNRFKAFLKPGVGKFDGVPVAKCAIPILEWCRANGWHGHLVSGWRDPKYSQHLCILMCGAPSCPGRCAGLLSNHVGNTPARFGVDVSDYANFGHIVARCPIQPHIHNALGARDPVHFSPSGR